MRRTNRQHVDDKSYRQDAIWRIIIAVLILVNIALGYGAFLSPLGIRGYLQKRKTISRLQRQIDLVNSENQRLYRQIQRFKESKRFQERVVRSELGWVKGRDEIVIEIPESDMERK